MPLDIIITDVGRAAIVDADNMGTLPVVINEVALGTGLWAPDATATALQNELKRITTVGGQAIADDTIHVTMTDDSSDAYTLGEFGLYTDGGVLFAIYSDVNGITDKDAGAALLMAFDILLASVPAGSVTVGGTGFNNPSATETQQGVAELATQSEASTGTDDVRIMTPLKAKTAAAAYTYTADQAIAEGEANTGTLAQLFSWFAKLIKGITGKGDWKTAPATTLEEAATHAGSTSNPHGVTKTQVGLSNVSNDAQLKIASNLSDLSNPSTARGNLGIGQSVLVYNPGSIALPNDAGANWDWASEDFDDNNFHDPGNPSRLTVDDSVSRVLVTVHVAFPSNADGRRSVILYRNGSSVARAYVTAVSGTETVLEINKIFSVNAGDYFVVSLYQNSGVSLSIAGGKYTYFALTALR